ncbi:hypothetical protein [Listeria booriae]|uniref:Uncharacterized protein n=1 Tax=Listeria booriae TaxID=1552123 RepID=A0A7X1DL47_9LIST|nr:hypothetical protein [Listeria booriae]MBC2284914.1 hypothetical protein [Listeria booriae]MBC2294496.1 hypothetical protein [Listeria booriae]MBC2311084.1 hypothetical protein [Listeria booriae]
MKKFFIYAVQVLILIVPAFYFGLADKTTAMGIALAASFFAIAFINFDEIKTLSAGTIKLEKFEKVIEEANATIENIRKVTAPLSAYTLRTVYANKSMSYKEAIEIIEGISDANRVVNDPIVNHLLDDKVNQIAEKFKYAFEMAGDNLAYHWTIQKKTCEQLIDKVPNPRELELFIGSEDFLDSEEALDLKYFGPSVAQFRENAKPILSDYKGFYNKYVVKSLRQKVL